MGFDLPLPVEEIVKLNFGRTDLLIITVPDNNRPSVAEIEGLKYDLQAAGLTCPILVVPHGWELSAMAEGPARGLYENLKARFDPS